MLPFAVVACAYLLGSIPFGYLIVRGSGGGDVRETGSGGTGATNVTRRAGRGAGVVTLALDALKGAAAVAIARWLIAPMDAAGWWVVAAAAVAAVLGHIFPVWLKFRGGKGVATGLGAFVVLAPLAVAGVAVVFLLIVWRTRYVSLGSITGAALLPLFVWLWGSRSTETHVGLAPLVAAAVAASAFVIFMHRANIKRLREGTENKLK